jgi:dTDP-4-dehydrorhamnose 3,5-epimerase
MKFIESPIKDLFVIEPKIWKDSRGYFYESYSSNSFEGHDIKATFVQDNQSFSQKGTLRGLHAQAPPFAQGKLVRVLQGSVLDIAVDIRKNSSTYGQYFSVELSGTNHLQLWIPPGFLHGFITLADDTIFTYKVTNNYNRSSEFGVIWNDPDLQIDWGNSIPENEFLLSEKDLILPNFKALESPF